jgi:hypothetical protein
VTAQLGQWPPDHHARVYVTPPRSAMKTWDQVIKRGERRRMRLPGRKRQGFSAWAETAAR